MYCIAKKEYVLRNNGIEANLLTKCIYLNKKIIGKTASNKSKYSYRQQSLPWMYLMDLYNTQNMLYVKREPFIELKW